MSPHRNFADHGFVPMSAAIPVLREGAGTAAPVLGRGRRSGPTADDAPAADGACAQEHAAARFVERVGTGKCRSGATDPKRRARNLPRSKLQTFQAGSGERRGWRKRMGVEPTQDRLAAPPGFEVRTPHRGRFSSKPCRSGVRALCRSSNSGGCYHFAAAHLLPWPLSFAGSRRQSAPQRRHPSRHGVATGAEAGRTPGARRGDALCREWGAATGS